MSAYKNLVGIDLGTCYSSIAVLDEHGLAQTVPNVEGEASTPSVVFLSEEGPIVGTKAEDAAREHPERAIFHSKRYLGVADYTWEVNGIDYTPVDIAAFILRKLKRDAEQKIGKVRQAAITVPAHFNSHQRSLTLEAAQQAGLEVLEILNEPVAAALCYILGDEGAGFAGAVNSQRVLVYDLGGGTFDLSVVEYQAEQIRVLCANGDLRLGGIDWNQRLIDYVAEQSIKRLKFDPRKQQNRQLFAALSRAVERAKRKLSETKDAIGIPVRNRKQQTSIKINQAEFENLTKDLVVRTRTLLEQIISSTPARVGSSKKGGLSDIDVVLIVGGSSRMPMIQKMVNDLVRTKVQPIDPELSIAHGAALYAGLVAGKADPQAMSRDAQERLGAFGMQQVNALTLGMLVLDPSGERVMHPLIPQDTPLPATARVAVTTVRHNQQRVSLKIVEAGELNEVCRCVLNDLPPNLPEGSLFNVDLTYDPSGLLHVVAQHQSTGRLATVSVERQLPESVGANSRD